MDPLSNSPGIRPRATRTGHCDASWWYFGEFEGSPVRAALAERDIGTLFRFLRSRGWSVSAISRATGISENQARRIMTGQQQVQTYDVLDRVASGLDIPRGLMGLAYTSWPGPEAD